MPVGSTAVSATGTGYQGVRVDEAAKVTVVAWMVPRMAPKDQQAFTITLSRAGTAADNVRGSVRWTKPAVKTTPSDTITIAPAPIAGQTR